MRSTESDTTKYYIHAELEADGVVERSDVVGAIYGQTEGLLGDELDLRDLQKSSKISRMEVNVESEGGSSYGTVTVGSSLDRVETSVLAASLETIERIGPCEASVEVVGVEDVRTAKRKEIVERAKTIHNELFDGTAMDTDEMLRRVREDVRKGRIDDYAGHPAGPKVEDSDAVVVVEGRADVLNLLKHGVKNAVGVEGTDVPDEIAGLTRDRTVTAFLDSDRGGDLILRELAQVGDVDHVAQPPSGKCVEDLSGEEIHEALREKTPYGTYVERDADGAGDDAGTSDGQSDGEVGGEVSIAPEADDGEAVLLDRDRNELSRVGVDELGDELGGRNGEVHSIVVGGEVSQSVLDTASAGGVETVVGDGLGHVAKEPFDVNVVTSGELPKP